MRYRFKMPSILVIGHGRHGKDTAAGLLGRLSGLRFMSSSEFAGRVAVFPLVADLYPDFEAFFADRFAHRGLWFHAIAAYNLRPGPSLVEQVLADHDVYVGLRSRAEFEAARGLFDVVVWVDRSEILPPEPGASMELSAADADVVLDNNGGVGFLAAQVGQLVQSLGLAVADA